MLRVPLLATVTAPASLHCARCPETEQPVCAAVPPPPPSAIRPPAEPASPPPPATLWAKIACEPLPVVVIEPALPTMTFPEGAPLPPTPLRANRPAAPPPKPPLPPVAWPTIPREHSPAVLSWPQL